MKLTSERGLEKLIIVLTLPSILAGISAFAAFGVVASIILFGIISVGVLALGSLAISQVASRRAMFAWLWLVTVVFLVTLALGAVGLLVVTV